MRWKFESSIASEYRVCLCLHVRTGTILYGLWNVFVHIFALAVLVFVAINPSLASSYHREYIFSPGVDNTQNNDSAAAIYKDIYVKRTWTSDDLCLATLITLGSFFLALLMVFGAFKGRASYLMPFFSVQVFDLCVTCLSVLGYFSYVSDLKRWIAVQDDVPFREQLLAMDNNMLSLLAITAFISVLLVKSYLLGMVWSCYKYLQSYERQRTRGMTEGYSADPEASEMLLPPKYEEAIRMPFDVSTGPAPPAYTPN